VIELSALLRRWAFRGSMLVVPRVFVAEWMRMRLSNWS
jgi:hypothetical protein